MLRVMMNDLSVLFSLEGREPVVDQFILPPRVSDGMRQAFEGAGSHIHSAVKRGHRNQMNTKQPNLSMGGGCAREQEETDSIGEERQQYD